MTLLNVAVIFVVGCMAVATAKTCDRKFSDVTKTHTACKVIRSMPAQRGVSKKLQQEIVDLHNKLRGDVGNKKYRQPAATNMMKLYWDDEIAMIAQKQADTCVYGHPKGYQINIPGRMTLGQNLAHGQTSFEDAILDWHYEVHDYNYYTNAKTREWTKTRPRSDPRFTVRRVRVQIGHYTQVVWATTNRIGCGYAYCNGLRDHYVCNYGPAGNMGGEKPYKKGPSAGDCPRTRTGGLCDCGKNKLCLNGGTLDPNTCTCTCPRAKWLRSGDCGLVCSKATNTGCPYPKSDCRIFGNVPTDYCPRKCNQCPGGDISNQPEGGKKIPPSSNQSGNGNTNGSTRPKPRPQPRPQPKPQPRPTNRRSCRTPMGSRIRLNQFWMNWKNKQVFYCTSSGLKRGCRTSIGFMKQGQKKVGHKKCSCSVRGAFVSSWCSWSMSG